MNQMNRYAVCFKDKNDVICADQIFKVSSDLEPEDLCVDEKTIMFFFVKTEKSKEELAKEMVSIKISAKLNAISRVDIEDNKIFVCGEPIAENMFNCNGALLAIPDFTLTLIPV